MISLLPKPTKVYTTDRTDIAVLHRLGCKVCPLAKVKGNRHPQMEPTGSDSPLVYILGEAPGKCISGDSLIDTAFRDKSKYPNGIPIKDLVDKKNFYVYSYDIRNEKLTLGKVKRVWKTGRKKVYRVTYEWFYAEGKTRIRKENSLVVTSNHPFLLRNPTLYKDPFKGLSSSTRYLSIDQGLQIGHSLQPFNRHLGERGFIATAGSQRFIETRFLLEHKLGKALPRGKSHNVHHKDDNPLNDSEDNIELLTVNDHARHHMTLNNPMYNAKHKESHLKVIKSTEYRKKIGLSQKKHLANPDNYAKRIASIHATNESRSKTVKAKFNDPIFYRRYLEARKDRFGWDDNEIKRRMCIRFPTSDNHKIVNIEYLGIQTVYDMEVLTHHNFAVNGIFVHNSEDWENEQFVGKSGEMLRPKIPRAMRDRVRFNNVVRCFISPKVLIYTSTGYKPIGRVQIGDLVLTHKGKFRKVISRLHDLPLKDRRYVGDLIQIQIQSDDYGSRGVPKIITQTVTPEHRYLLPNGKWVLAKNLKAGDQITVTAAICEQCGNEYQSFGRSSNFCHIDCKNRSIASRPEVRAKIAKSMREQIATGRRDLTFAEKRRSHAVRKLVKAGKHNLQNLSPESRWKAQVNKAYRIRGEKEEYFEEALLNADFKVIVGFKIPIESKRTVCVYDLFLPELNILIEIDGKSHNNNSTAKRDRLKDETAKEAGFILLRKGYLTNPNELVNEIRRLEVNHNDDYHFITRPILSVLRFKSNKTQYLYCLEVEGDSSFIANGIVSHNSRPFKNETPTFAAIESCRPSIIADIEKTKPKAIFGFGNIPLHWATGWSGIKLWRGRKLPVKIGNHVCWYYAFNHPAAILRANNRSTREGMEFVFKMDLKRAFKEIESIPEADVHTPERARANIDIFTSEDPDVINKIAAAFEWAHQQMVVGIDYETKGIRPYTDWAKILTIAVGNEEYAFSFALDHKDAGWTQAQLEQIEELWVDFLLTYKGFKAVHNLAFELEWTGYFFGPDLLRVGKWECTASQAAIIDERRGQKGQTGPFSLEFLGQQYFGFNIKALTNVNRKDIESESLETTLIYNAIDARYHAGLWLRQVDIIRSEGITQAYGLARRRVPTAVLSQLKGIPVNQKEVKRLQIKYRERLEKLDTDIANLSIIRKFVREEGHAFKPLSNPDVMTVMWDMLKRPECRVIEKYTGDKKLSANEEVLAKIPKDDGDAYKLAQLLLVYRKVNKSKSTYIDPLATPVDPQDKNNGVLYPDGLLHPNYNTFFVETSRLSCVRKGTAIMVPGGTKPIEEIKPGDWVFSFDNNSQPTLKRVKHRIYMGCKAVLRVHWIGKGKNRKGYLDITPDHKVRLTSGKYCRADQLRSGILATKGKRKGGYHGGDHVLAINRVLRNKYNYLYITGNIASKESRIIFEALHNFSPEHIHHIDGNKLNDDPKNLEGLTAKEHTSLHTKIAMSKPGEARRRMLIRTPETIERVNEAVRAGIQAKADSRFTKEEIIEALQKGKGVKRAAAILGCDQGSIRSRIDKWNITNWDGRKLRKERPEQRKARGPYKGHTKYVTPSKYNHVIQYTEKLSGKYPVYDLEIEDTHNFIANEICVHNCDAPNVQNWPKREEEWREVRKPIQAPDDCIIVAFDYGQIEARVAAMFTKDPRYVKMLWDRYDIHMDWAERLARAYPRRIGGKDKLKDKKAMKDFRTDIKNQWTFPLIFGAQLSSAAGYLSIPEDVIEPYYNEFWDEFATIKKWHEETLEFYLEHGYVQLLTGRRRHAPLSPNAIYNTPIQGTAAEIVLDAMSRLSELNNLEIQPEINIHDDLTFMRIPERKLDEYSEIIIGEMLAVPFDWINVPITIERSIGYNWLEMEEAGTFSSDEWGK